MLPLFADLPICGLRQAADPVEALRQKTRTKTQGNKKPRALVEHRGLTSVALRFSRAKKWWLGTESNRRHADFQSAALPTELPSHARDRNYTDVFSFWQVPFSFFLLFFIFSASPACLQFVGRAGNTPLSHPSPLFCSPCRQPFCRREHGICRRCAFLRLSGRVRCRRPIGLSGHVRRACALRALRAVAGLPGARACRERLCRRQARLARDRDPDAHRHHFGRLARLGHDRLHRRLGRGHREPRVASHSCLLVQRAHVLSHGHVVRHREHHGRGVHVDRPCGRRRPGDHGRSHRLGHLLSCSCRLPLRPQSPSCTRA